MSSMEPQFCRLNFLPSIISHGIEYYNLYVIRILPISMRETITFRKINFLLTVFSSSRSQLKFACLMKWALLELTWSGTLPL